MWVSMCVCVCIAYSAQKPLTHRNVHTSAHLQCNGIFFFVCFAQYAVREAQNKLDYRMKGQSVAINKPNNNITNFNLYYTAGRHAQTHAGLFNMRFSLFNQLFDLWNCIKTCGQMRKTETICTHTHRHEHTWYRKQLSNYWYTVGTWKCKTDLIPKIK